MPPLERSGFPDKSAWFPMLFDEAVRLVAQQEPSHDDTSRSYQPTTTAHDRRHAYAAARAENASQLRACGSPVHGIFGPLTRHRDA